MHIIAIEYEPSTKRGGQERSYFDILTELAKNGHQVSLYYVKEGDLLAQYRSVGIALRKIPAINIFAKFSPFAWFVFFMSVFRIQASKTSIIYINQIQDLPLAAMVKVLKGAVRLVCHLRLPPMYPHMKSSNGQLAIAEKYVDSYIVANENMKMAHSNAGLPEQKIHIVPNGFQFDVLYDQKQIRIQDLKLLFIGRFDSSKGLKELISSLPSILTKYPNTILTVAGTPMYESQQKYLADCHAYASELGISASIVYVGHVQNAVEFIKDFDITIFPSTWNEPFGRVLVESVMAGVPVLARNVGATAEILCDCESDFLYHHDSELVYVVEFLINHQQEYDIHALQEIHRRIYSINAVVKCITKIIEAKEC